MIDIPVRSEGAQFLKPQVNFFPGWLRNVDDSEVFLRFNFQEIGETCSDFEFTPGVDYPDSKTVRLTFTIRNDNSYICDERKELGHIEALVIPFPDKRTVTVRLWDYLRGDERKKLRAFILSSPSEIRFLFSSRYQ